MNLHGFDLTSQDGRANANMIELIFH